jgi:squalene-associated FAD-dependent desaturase
MSAPSIAVVGGGLAGLRAAISCADAGARVTLLEARPRLGGATWSTRHQGLDIDNGQHVFLRCCTAYRGFIERLGAADGVVLQPRLAVPVLAPGGRVAWLRRGRGPSPLHLAGSLIRFAHLRPLARLRAGLSVRRLGRLDLADPVLDEVRFGDWLREQRQSPGAIRGFWDLLIRPTLNLPAEDASLALAAKVFQTGLLERADAADLGFARLPLARVHAEPAARALRAAGAEVRLRAPVDRIESTPRGPVVWSNGVRMTPNAVVLAVDHESAARLLPADAGLDANGIRSLGRAPVVNLHLHFDRRVMEYSFAAVLDSPLQWIFDRTEASGAAEGQVLAVSLSAADEWVGVSSGDLREVFLPAIEAVFPRARGARTLRLFATCERAATFHQRSGTRRHRPGAVTSAPGLFVAGAWTDTGWPATMEGAVRSGLAAAHHALRAAGISRSLPAEAA